MTPRFQEGVKLINCIEPAKLRLLFSRIATFLISDQSASPPSSPFTDEEKLKLEKSLELGLEDVHLVIDSASLILQQAAYHVIKPEMLKSKLMDGLNLDQERAAVIITVWSSNASLIVENLRKRSVLPYQLADLTWLLNLASSSDKSSRMKEPVATVELLLHSSESIDQQKVKLEMRKPELQNLYEKLEQIQVQLDALK